MRSINHDSEHVIRSTPASKLVVVGTTSKSPLFR